MIKDAHEIECLRIAGRATIRVYEAVYKSLKECMTQRDVGGLVQAAYARGLFRKCKSEYRRIHRLAARLPGTADHS